MNVWKLIGELVGQPYAIPSNPPASFDCWSLVEYVREQLGLFTPSLVPEIPELDGFEEYRENTLALGVWAQVQGVGRDGDVIILGDSHTGVGIDHGVLHAFRTRRGGSVVFWGWADVQRRYRKVERWAVIPQH